MLINDITLHELHLEDFQNPVHPSIYEEYQDYRVLLLSFPEYTNQTSTLSTHGFVFTPKAVYYYDPLKKGFIELEYGLKDVYQFLDKKIDKLIEEIDLVQDKIARLEKHLYRKISSKFMEEWHILKKALSPTERIIVRATDTLDRFMAKSKTSEHFLHNEFNDLHEHLERTIRATISSNEQLENLYHYYTLHSNDRLNRSIYTLTIISVIFLPLNLVVGFFGMNTGGLPFQHSEYGTIYAFVCMIIFAALLTTFVLKEIKKE